MSAFVLICPVGKVLCSSVVRYLFERASTKGAFSRTKVEGGTKKGARGYACSGFKIPNNNLFR